MTVGYFAVKPLNWDYGDEFLTYAVNANEAAEKFLDEYGYDYDFDYDGAIVVVPLDAPE